MLWLIAGILCPFFISISNNIDQLLMRKDFVGDAKSYRVIIMFLRIIFLPILYFFVKDLSLPITSILLMMSVGVISYFSYAFYSRSLELDEASKIVAYLQTIPIFMFVILFFLYGEKITFIQFLGCCLLIGSSMAMMVNKNPFNTKLKIAFLVLLSALWFAIGNVIQRAVLIEGTPWYALLYWVILGGVIMSIILILKTPTTISKIKSLIINKNYKVFSLIGLQELFFNAGYICFILSLKYSPAAVLTQSLAGFQPIFVLVSGWAFSRAFPDYFSPPENRYEWSRYLFFMAIMLIGVFMVYGVTP